MDIVIKFSTFAPALLERQSLTIDILLENMASENKNKKTSKKFGCYLKKFLSLQSDSQRNAVCFSSLPSFPFAREPEKRYKKKN